ncbi:MAG: sodium:solute symporter, partial [Clostridia bacterium]
MKITVLVLYGLMMVCVLVISARKSLNVHDFFLGGRKMGPWFSAFAYGTSYFSAVIIIGYAGKIGWGHGLSATWIGIGNAFLGNWLAWRVLAGRTHRMGLSLGVCTMPGFFEKRYDSKALKVFSALLIFVFLVPYSASVYQGMGYLFEVALGLDFFWCVLGIAALASLYLFAGGYRATSISDFLQGCIMLVGIVLMVIFVVRGASVDPVTGQSGGLSAVFRRMNEAGGAGFASILGPKGQEKSLLSLVLLTSFGTWGLPQMMHKFFAIRDQAAVKQATVISTVFCLLLAGGAYFMGGFGRQILGNQVPAGGLDHVMPQVFTSVAVGMPDALLGLVVVLVLSASMSTLTSLVLASASALVLDLGSVVCPQMKPKT